MAGKASCTEFDPAALLEEAGIGIVRLDRALRVTSASSRAAVLLLTTRKGIEGSPIEDALPGPAHEKLSGALARSVREAVPVEVELFLPRSGGLWRSCRLVPRTDGFILILQDVTAARRTANELLDSEERFRAIRDATFGGIAIHDKGVILECNKGLSDITGFSREELVGRDGLVLVSPGWRGLVMQRILGGCTEAYDVEGVRKDGSVYPLEIRGRNIPFRGQMMRVTEFRDITERMRGEQERRRLFDELENERGKLAAILDQLPSGINIAAAPSGSITYQNAAARTLIGKALQPCESCKDYGRFGAIHADGTPYAPEEYPLCRALRGERISIEEMIYRRDDGALTTFSVSAGPVCGSQGDIVAAVSTFNDIDARKRMEASLRESEERYRTLYQSLGQGVCEYDENGALVSANPAADEILGVELQGMKGLRSQAILAAMPPLSNPDGSPYGEEGDVVRLSLETGAAQPERLVRILNPRKESPVWILAYAVPRLTPASARPSGVFVIFSDVTGLKDTEESLHLLNEELEHEVRTRTEDLSRTAAMLEGQKELLQGIIDNIPVMIALLDPSGRVKLINREYERVTGWSLDEARRMDILAATHPEPAERERAVQAVARSQPGWIDFDIHTRSGLVLKTSWANVRFSDGSAMGIGIDISARRKMEQDLLRLATAVQQSGEGIIVASVDGVIEYVNPAFESISGYGLDELAGRKAHALDDYFNGYSLEEILTRTVLEGMTWTGRQQRKRKSGEIIDVDLSVSPVRDESGRITHFVSVVRDITRETRLQKQLALSQRMEAIGSLAGGIAHDLKNILTPILINTEIALEDMGEDSPSYPVLEEVLAAARLGRDLVQQILTFSRRAPQKKTPVNIPAVVRETLSFLRSTLPSTIEIRDELSDDRVMTYADATQIKQVLINLGSNAGYAMREAGGVLDVRETSMVLDEQTALQVSPDLKAGHYVQISVHDTGYGMDEGTMEHIFEPFFTTKKGEGTGMGLAVAHGIVKEHQGAITVKSTPGQGSTFTVMLPELEDGKEEDVRCRTSDTS